MVLLPRSFGLEQLRIETQNNFVVACYGYDYVAIFFGFCALGLAFLYGKDWGRWAYALMVASVLTIAVGFNFGGALCPEYVPSNVSPPQMPPFF